MTRRDLFIQIISEATGRPEEDVIEIIKAFAGSESNFFKNPDAELPVENAQKIMDELRAMKPFIKEWFDAGAARVERRFFSKN